MSNCLRSKQVPTPSITLALDSDEPGQAAVNDAGLLILDIFQDWGVPRLPAEPEAHALAAGQQAYSLEAAHLQSLEAAADHGADLAERIEQSEDTLFLIWDYCESLRRTLKRTAYSTANDADEYCMAQTAIDTPMRDESGKLDYAAIKAKVDIVEYIGRDTDLIQRGGKWLGKCMLPGHTDSTASLWVYPETRSFYCFGCRRGGDVIDYATHKGLKAKQL